ncbi:Lrp/AsnC family transcriptional regulator [Ktedonosporobacter rubrisoli]|uniref:Lrp/AsnC family transcriptional regulator n=1 Tax=Ktedonosporobacter rubrisoli TaxID=2509675 RepID=A0A4P6JQ55_KTERU|nr:Lrp/AsnC family transcriptional regulator [Ktedonosporobacter rubrisoli]QBD77538.1 Lrp/AsnC family transcriptional regulator [Ktedonosporobacter rubrisoli]
MSFEVEKLLDETGWRLLFELQENARLSYHELGQRVGLSSPAVADRIRRMEEAGIISGYHAEVNLARVGLPIMALIRLKGMTGQSCQRVAAMASEIPEVIECYRVTGSDMVVIKAVASSVDHLESIVNQLNLYGLPSTSIVFSNPLQRRTITQEMVQRTGKENLLSRTELPHM